MKKTSILFVVLALTLMLAAACGQKQAPTGTESGSSTEQVGEGVAAVDTLTEDLGTEDTEAAASDLEEVTW